MTEEIKNEEKECACKQCECCQKLLAGLKEFTFKALIIYVGVTLAIITSANILKPKRICPMGYPYPRMERPIPPMMMHRNFDGGHFRRHHKDFHKIKPVDRKFEKGLPQTPPKAEK
jgi:hypothetical protein